MTSSDFHDLRKAFMIYKNTVSKTNMDIDFYRSFLKNSIDVYLNNGYHPENLYSSVFHAYNITPDTGSGLSRMYKEADQVRTIDLYKSSESFMCTIANQSLLSIYNAMEIFLFQAIKIRYFGDLKNPTGSRQATNAVTLAMENDLLAREKKTKKRNNNYILSFLEERSPEVTSFLQKKIRTDLVTNWKNFFELLSILRNLIGHHGTIVSLETQNEIDSKAKDVFKRHFELCKDENGHDNLLPRIDQFSNFINFYNEFTMNTVKFIFGYDDFEIFDMF